MLIITHVYGTGPPQDLEEYLRGRVASLLFIGHPFPYAMDRRSFWRRYDRGKIVAHGQAFNWRGPEVIFYLKDACLTLYWACRHGHTRYDLVVGAGGFNAVIALVIKMLGRAKKVVFYCIDWMPRRFKNPLLNELYHLLDRLAVIYADRTWNLSARMVEARAQRGMATTPKQMIVPVGIWLKRFKYRTRRSAGKFSIMYMGHVRAGQGLALLMAAWPRIVERYDTATLHIVGDGPLKQPLQARMATTTSADTVIWHGFVPNHRQVEELLCGKDLAVAMYEPGTFTQYTDPGKLKVYLAAGLPVVMTDIGAMAGVIEQQRAGLVIPYEEMALIEAISTLLSDRESREAMGRAARQIAARYDWEEIFAQALIQSW